MTASGDGDIRGRSSTTDVTLTIDIGGVPAPQGSKSYKGMRAGKPVLAESSKKVTPWRAQVVTAAKARMRLTGAVTLTGPVHGEAWFWLPRPQTMPRERVVDGVAYPIAYPDLSKLIRSTEDALVTAEVVADDALFCDWDLHKRYTTNGTIGARVTLTPIGGVLL